MLLKIMTSTDPLSLFKVMVCKVRDMFLKARSVPST